MCWENVEEIENTFLHNHLYKLKTLLVSYKMNLKVFTDTIHGPCFLDEHQNITRCQSHRSNKKIQ